MRKRETVTDAPSDGPEGACSRDILAFLVREFAREGSRRCVTVELWYVPGGDYYDEIIRRWGQADDAELFEAALSDVEGLAAAILQTARDEADGPRNREVVGEHRFVIRACQYIGIRQEFSFSLPVRGGREEEDQMAKSEDKNKVFAPLDPRKQLLASMAAHHAASLLLEGSEKTSSSDAIAEIAVDVAEAILKRVGL